LRAVNDPGSSGLRHLAAQPMWRRWTLASWLARLPLTMTLIALVLVGEELTGSVATGAQLSGLAIAVSGFSAPLRGRQLDRGELRRGLQRACLGSAGVFALFAVALVLRAPLLVFALLAVAQGVVAAAVSGGYRALLVPVVSAADLPRANTLEAVFIEVAFVSGPAIAGLLALLVGPLGVLLFMSAAMAGAAAVTGKLPSWRAETDASALAPWRTPGAWPVFAIAFGTGLALGLLEAAVPGRTVELGWDAARSGYLLALVAGGSAVGGLLATRLRDALGNPVRRGVLLLGALGLLLAPTAVAGSIPLLGVALLVSGLPIAPLNALGAIYLQRTLPPGRLAEGFSVFIAAILLGAGLGQSIVGLLLDDVGARLLLLGSAAVPLLLALVLTGGGARHLRRPRLAAVAAPASD
jgi:MFS family permease